MATNDKPGTSQLFEAGDQMKEHVKNSKNVAVVEDTASRVQTKDNVGRKRKQMTSKKLHEMSAKTEEAAVPDEDEFSTQQKTTVPTEKTIENDSCMAEEDDDDSDGEIDRPRATAKKPSKCDEISPVTLHFTEGTLSAFRVEKKIYVYVVNKRLFLIILREKDGLRNTGKKYSKRVKLDQTHPTVTIDGKVYGYFMYVLSQHDFRILVRNSNDIIKAFKNLKCEVNDSDSEEEKGDDKTAYMCDLAGDKRCIVKRWNGKNRLDMRTWFSDCLDRRIPTKNGMCMSKKATIRLISPESPLMTVIFKQMT